MVARVNVLVAARIIVSVVDSLGTTSVWIVVTTKPLSKDLGGA